MPLLPFDDFLRALADLGAATREDPKVKAQIEALIQQLRLVGPITKESLASFVATYPAAVPLIATCAGLGQEQLMNQLRLRVGSSGWVKLARENAELLITVLDEGFGLVEKVAEHLRREWRLEDVLLERHLWSRKQAASAVGQGRSVEDEVERVVKALGLPYRMRTQFTGRGGDTAPCDMAISDSVQETHIVIAMKGFNSTGSKLSDAVREVEQMARVRRPSQFVYCVIDGIGWLSRQADLRRLHNLWSSNEIDGMYTLAHMPTFQVELNQAARRKGLL